MKYDDPEKLYKIIQYIKTTEPYLTKEEILASFEIHPNCGDTILMIPARSSSKRVKNKNIYKINGIPLIAYTILLGKQLKQIDRIIVSTDSIEFAEIAKEYGAEVPFLRPKSLSLDNSSLGNLATLVVDYVSLIERRARRRIITMLPTNPFRNLNDMQKLLEEVDNCSHMCSGFNVNVDISKICVSSQTGLKFIEPYIKKPLPKHNCYKHTGMLSSINMYYKHKYGRSFKFYNITNPIELIDIDSMDDIKLAEIIIKENIYDFGFKLC
ncbi:MAG: hypothetical protein HQK79_04350 [Desulfobacterales bacterium]|nr:hypothetical protein [Desulfobacterales bacterium]